MNGRRGGRISSGDPRERIRLEEDANQALRLWMSGQSYASIARATGVTKQTAWRRVQRAIDAQRPHADWDAYVAECLAELAVARRPLRRVISRYGLSDENGVPFYTLDEFLRTLKALMELQNQVLRLTGADRAPAPLDDLTNMSDDELEELVAAWATDIRAAETQ